jgi:hypothetical protein
MMSPLVETQVMVVAVVVRWESLERATLHPSGACKQTTTCRRSVKRERNGHTHTEREKGKERVMVK